jgi:hypothetical protein
MVSEAEIIIDKCIGVKTGEKCTVVTDSTRRVEGEVIAAVARARGASPLGRYISICHSSPCWQIRGTS